MSDSAQMERERRLAAIMFTDMVGYTALTQRNETLAMELLEEQRRVIRSSLAKHKGREVDTIGDGFLVEFTSALDAVSCAVEIQSAFRDANAGRPQERQVWIRIGVHLGDVIPIGNKVAGDAVNIASRIEPLASPGGVCVSAQVYGSVAGRLESKFESLGFPPLKNVANPIEVYQIAGFGIADNRPIPNKISSASDRVAVLPLAVERVVEHGRRMDPAVVDVDRREEQPLRIPARELERHRMDLAIAFLELEHREPVVLVSG